MADPRPWWESVDWLRLAQRGTTLARALLEDPDLEADTTREKIRAGKVRATIDQVGRAVVGCLNTQDCDCPICRDGSGTRPNL